MVCEKSSMYPICIEIPKIQQPSFHGNEKHSKYARFNTFMNIVEQDMIIIYLL